MRNYHLSLKRNTIGSRIKKARYQLGITQQQLADHVGRGRSAVAQWERDDCEPSVATIAKMAPLLQTSATYLAFGLDLDKTLDVNGDADWISSVY